MTTPASRRTFLMAAGASVLAAQSHKPIRLGIIGTGHRGWAHIAVLKAIPEFQIVALADPTPAFLDQAASLAPGAATYSDYHKLLERTDLDAVAVVVPSFLHAEVTIAALNRGLDVLCEKPMATTVADADRMIEAARKSGRILYIGFQKRFVPTHAKLHELAAAGEIGKIEFVSGRNLRGDWNPQSWKYTDPKTGVATNWRYLTHTEGSALLEDGIHEVDALNWIINDRVVRVVASGGNNVYKNRETIDHAGILVEYENGVKLTFDFCLFASNVGPAGREMLLVGSDGVMEPERGRVAIRKRGSPVRYVEVAENTPAAATAHQVGTAQDPETYTQYLAFAESVRTRKPPAVSGESAKLAVKIMLLADKSLREHRILNWSDLPA